MEYRTPSGVKSAQKIFSIHKILVMVFQYSHCQDTGSPGDNAI